MINGNHHEFMSSFLILCFQDPAMLNMNDHIYQVSPKELIIFTSDLTIKTNLRESIESLPEFYP